MIVKLFESFSQMESIYGKYDLSNSNDITDFLQNLKMANVNYTYDPMANFVKIEFCGGFVGDDIKKELILNGLENIKSYKMTDEESMDIEDDVLQISPMKFH